ncbi:MAG: AI-2E family transporter [Chloroflexi bacterium]|nr:AI-2E family transporter [Chloroflexota bacterium]
MSKNWSRTNKIYISILLFIFGVWVFSLIKGMIAPLVIAALLAYLLNPLVNRLKKYTRLDHVWAVSLVYSLFVLALVTVLLNFVPLVARQAQTLTTELHLIGPRLEADIETIARRFDIQVDLQPIWDEIQSASSGLLNPDRVFRMIRSASTNLGWMLIILVTVYYLLVDWVRLREWIFGLFSPDYQGDARRLHVEIKVVWAAYLRGQLTLMLIVGILSGIGAASIGLPMAAFFGLLAGTLDLIPSFGPTVTLLVAVIVAWFKGSSYLAISNLWLTVLTVVLFSAIQVLENVVLQPYIMGRRLKIHPGVVFISVVGALTLGSALIALIIVPTVVSLSIIGRYIRCRLFELDPWEDDPIVLRDGEISGEL